MDYIKNILFKDSLGSSLVEILIIFSFLVFSIFLRGVFAKFIISKIKRIIIKTGNSVDDKLFEALSPPLKILPFIFVFVFATFFSNLESSFGVFLEKINRSLITIFIFWFMHQSLAPLSQALQRLEEKLSKAMVIWLTKFLKYLIIFLGIVAVLEIWNIKVGPVIAGLGLFGVAVALGAQDLFKNLISGIMIILEKRFNINDIIELPDRVIGTVEHIGFRSTLIRKFDSTPVSIPNYVFSDSLVINFSDRKYRRINWIIGLTYDTSTEQLKNICSEIESSIKLDENFTINDAYKLFVSVEKFNDSSIDILISAFTNTNDWEKFLKIRENLVLNIKYIVEKNSSSFAFPSQSIYIEKN